MNKFIINKSKYVINLKKEKEKYIGRILLLKEREKSL